MDDLQFELTDKRSTEDIDFVEAGLRRYNIEHGRIADEVRDLFVYARDEDGKIVGGVLGRTWGVCAQICVLWVDEARRGQGLGTTLMKRAEEEAVRRGCTLAYLDTFTFQAPAFYEGLGYRTRYSISGFPRDLRQLYYEKRLA